MRYAEWRAHILVAQGSEIWHREQLLAHAKTCPICHDRAKTVRQNKARRDRHEIMTSMGLKRVKGNLGGTYYE